MNGEETRFVFCMNGLVRFHIVAHGFYFCPGRFIFSPMASRSPNFTSAARTTPARASVHSRTRTPAGSSREGCSIVLKPRDIVHTLPLLAQSPPDG